MYVGAFDEVHWVYTVVAAGRFEAEAVLSMTLRDVREDWAVIRVPHRITEGTVAPLRERLPTGYRIDGTARVSQRQPIRIVRGPLATNAPPSVVRTRISASPFETDSPFIPIRTSLLLKQGDSGAPVILESSNTIIGTHVAAYEKLAGDIPLVLRLPPEVAGILEELEATVE